MTLEEFSKVMQTLDCILGMHNCVQEPIDGLLLYRISSNLPRVKMKLCERAEKVLRCLTKHKLSTHMGCHKNTENYDKR